MKLKCTQNGTSTVEFAMILPFLLVILFGIMEFGLLLYDKAIITNASREAARSGIAYKDPKLTTEDIQKVVIDPDKGYARFLISSQSGIKPTVTVTSPTPEISGSSLTVKVDYPYQFFVFGSLYNLYMNGSMSNTITISATTVMNHE